jgi:CRISPR-associated protein Csh1
VNNLLEAVALIGNILAQEGHPVAGLVQPLPKPPKVDKVYIIKLDFRPDPHRLRLTVDLQESDEDALVRYRWVGNSVGNRPQLYLTTNKLEYLLTQAPVNLLQSLDRAGLQSGTLYRRLSVLVEQLFRSLPDGTRILDLQRLGIVKEDVVAQAWEETAGKPREKAKAVIAAVSGAFKKWALREIDLKAPEAGLWTVLWEGQPLVADPDYAATILQAKEGAVTGTGNEGICSVCGASNQPVTSDFAQLDFLKYYITDKIGAASGVTKRGFKHNFVVCAGCFRGLLLTEKYVRQNFNLNVGPLSFLVLPAFLREVGLSRGDLETLAGRLAARVGVLTNVSRWIENLAGRNSLEAELQDLLDENSPYENLALLNLLFYRKSKSEFRIFSLVKDVAPSRIGRLLRQGYRLAYRADMLFGPDRWWLDLTSIYRLIPLNVSEGAQKAEYKKLLRIYACLLADEPLERAFLMERFVALVRIYHTGNYAGTNVPPPTSGYEELEWSRRLLQANLFLKLLREENLLRGGKCVSAATNGNAEIEVQGLPEEIRAYLNEMAYEVPETALFLLGYLLNQVGRAQAGSGYEHKPVLEKINYNGMHWGKVVRLSNILVDHLRQHDILRYNEGLFAAMKRLFDAYRQNWPLSPEENVFYILSGYAYGTRAAFKARAEKQAEKQNESSVEGGNLS